MATSHFFISYSRADLSFAESIGIGFLLARQPIWLDYLCLLPGWNWQQAISQGAATAAGVMVVVSPSAMASPNVADEVRQAVTLQKPLFLVFVRAARPVLLHAPEIDLCAAAHSIIDMRGNFEPALQKLLTACSLGTPVRDAVPKMGLSHARVPVHVAQVLACCGALAALFAWLGCRWASAANFPWQSPAACMNLGLSGLATVWLLFSAGLFYCRQMSRESFCTHCLIWSLLLPYDLLWQRTHVPGLAVDWWLLAIAAGVSAILIYRLFWSLDLLRWKRSQSAWNAPARGRQIAELLRRVEAVPKEMRPLLDPRPYVYSFTYSDEDQPIAEMIRKTLVDLEAERSRDNPFPPLMVQVLVVTNRLAPEKWSQFQALSGETKLYFLATPARIPENIFRETGKVQWVDVRTLVPAQLSFLSLYLRGYQPSRLLYATYYLPERLDALKTPNGFAPLFVGINFIAASSLVSNLFPIFFPRFRHFTPTLLPWATAIAIWQFWLAQTLCCRIRTLPQFVCELAISMALAAAVGVYGFLVSAGAVQNGFGTPIPFLFDRKYLIAAGALWLLLMGWGLYLLATTWFPRTGVWKPPATAPSWPKLFTGQLPYVLGAVISTAYFYANLSP